MVKRKNMLYIENILIFVSYVLSLSDLLSILINFNEYIGGIEK